MYMYMHRLSKFPLIIMQSEAVYYVIIMSLLHYFSPSHILVHKCTHTHIHTLALPQSMITDSEGEQDFVIVEDSSTDSEDEEEGDEVCVYVASVC